MLCTVSISSVSTEIPGYPRLVGSNLPIESACVKRRLKGPKICNKGAMIADHVTLLAAFLVISP